MKGKTAKSTTKTPKGKPAEEQESKRPLNVLLLENIHPTAEEGFQSRNFGRIEKPSGALPEEQLIKLLPDVHVLGIRSKTHITERVLKSAPQLMAVGCFCIGTDQVDIDAATRCGNAQGQQSHSFGGIFSLRQAKANPLGHFSR